jgi:hypothetical protein
LVGNLQWTVGLKIWVWMGLKCKSRTWKYKHTTETTGSTECRKSLIRRTTNRISMGRSLIHCVTVLERMIRKTHSGRPFPISKCRWELKIKWFLN